MREGLAIVDGHAVRLEEASIPVTDPAVTVGWSVFEALIAENGVTANLDAHLDRLADSCEAACIAMPPRGILETEIERVAGQVGGRVRVRVTLTGGGHRIVLAETAEPGRLHRPVRAVRGPHRDEPILGGAVKHGSRAPWIVAVRRSGVDEVLLVAAGRFMEGTSSAILAVIDGVIWCAPEDGRILPSTTRAILLEQAVKLHIPVRLEAPPASGPWDGLYIASVTRNLAPVVELDGEPLPGMEPIGRKLIEECP